MPIPTWVVGQVLSASDVNTWLVPSAVFKPTGQVVTSSTALVNDNDLVLPVTASATYLFRCWMSFTATSGGDIKWTWAVPAGAGLIYQALHNEGGGVVLNASATTFSDANTVTAAGGGGTVQGILMDGIMTVAGTGGNLQLRWAQNVSNAGATTVRSGYLTLQRMA